MMACLSSFSKHYGIRCLTLNTTTDNFCQFCHGFLHFELRDSLLEVCRLKLQCNLVDRKYNFLADRVDFQHENFSSPHQLRLRICKLSSSMEGKQNLFYATDTTGYTHQQSRQSSFVLEGMILNYVRPNAISIERPQYQSMKIYGGKKISK